MSDPMEQMFNKVYNKMINDIAQEWKAKTDETIKLMRRENKILVKRNNKSIDAFNLENQRYNQLVHRTNMERTQREILVLKLQSKIEKLKEVKEDG